MSRKQRTPTTGTTPELGIRYADEDSAPTPEELRADATDEDTGEDEGEDHDALPPATDAFDMNPQRAKEAIQAMRRRAKERQKLARTQGVTSERRKLPPPDPAKVAAGAPKLYRVTENAELPRGSSSVRFRVGKIVDSRNFNIPSLENAGVKLEPYTPPKSSR